MEQRNTLQIMTLVLNEMMHFEKKNTAGALFLALKQMPRAKCRVDVRINKYDFHV